HRPARPPSRALAHRNQQHARLIARAGARDSSPDTAECASAAWSQEEESMPDVTITPTDNGPYLVEGPARVVDAEGTEYTITEQTAIFLCRCGGSSTKPFCDGTHERLNFEAANRALETLERIPITS